jgi:hypothetical protein
MVPGVHSYEAGILAPSRRCRVGELDPRNGLRHSAQPVEATYKRLREGEDHE